MGSWRVVALVAEREVRQRLRSRAFVVITLIFALAIAALAAIPGLAGAWPRPLIARPRTSGSLGWRSTSSTRSTAPRWRR